MQEKTEKTHLTVDPFHTDFAGRLNYETLGRHLLNCAENHASARGFGMKKLNDENFTWVLSRLTIDIEEMPSVYARFDIETWIESVYRLFTNRNYKITGEDGLVYGYATSVWAMISLENRQAIDLHAMHGTLLDDYALPEKQCPIAKQERNCPISDDKLIRTIDTHYSDIDYNGHVNSMKYIEHICNLFPVSQYERMRLRRIEMAYMAESRFGDTLSFFVNDSGDDTYRVEVRKNHVPRQSKGDIVARCTLKFE